MTSNSQEDFIYSAQEYYEDIDSDHDTTIQDAIPQILDLNLRGVHIELDRETLVNLPESLLIAMFPNGLVLGPSEEEEEETVLGTEVDFDAACLQYVLKCYKEAQMITEGRKDEDERLVFASLPAARYYPSLLDKQAIIVLREELEYYCIVTTNSTLTVNQIKLSAGEYLKRQDQVFTALEKNIERDNSAAEHHLIDMLCDAGFSKESTWGYRELEPKHTCIISMSLVTLKTTGPSHHHLATAQKLLLFWRKPARKYWWDGNTVKIKGESIRLWARRTWTLELALI
ncbi:uncharacterized protein BX663DRAFT_465090 [Cokeromyces recurvatus]|uniref:uncharacterized protein n=1 Tax=Cokeromyces recurvatus TaxID=90255 RepID=UPI00221F0321|nr:uncharacterized protein BX663DRAFT_465090 [Cokeromyces recurvatus]KAI7906843.1 hypothetical protein BX663DRAFT_465090 [Cokeromyces recurvatus]